MIDSSFLKNAGISIVLCALFLLFLFLGTSDAAPSVSGVSGTVSNGNTLTVTGTGFTTISTTTFIFDQLESGSFSTGWQTHNDLAVYSGVTPRHAFSVYTSSLNFASNSVGDGFVQGNNSFTARDWYSSFWFMVGNDWDWGTTVFSGTDKFLSNIKFPVRYWSPGSEVENFYLQYDGANNEVKSQWEAFGGQGQATAIATARTTISKAVWHHVQMAFRDSSAVNQYDGSFKLWYDGALQYSTTSTRFKEDESANKRLQVIGMDSVWDCSEDGGGGVDSAGCQSPNSYYMDDIYNWNSLAHVEISTCSTYTACQREDQKPLTWTDTGLTLTFNEAALTGTKYMYVTDNAGVTSSSFQIGSVDTTSPTVSITAPADASTVSGSIPFTANASDDTAVAGVQFKVDGVNEGAEDTTSTYGVTWNTTGVADGSHALTAVARDAQGNTTTSSTVNVTVTNSVSPARRIRGGRFSGGTIR